MTEKQEFDIKDVSIRFTEAGDGKSLKEWLQEPGILQWFPMADDVEIDDAVMRWIAFSKYKCSLTAMYKGRPCGLTTLYLQPYKKLAHQCEFGIIVAPEFRSKGIGSVLLNALFGLAKERFKIELIHLQVYAENPAMRLYKRFGFREFGRQTHWIKDEGVYVARVFMERFL